MRKALYKKSNLAILLLLILSFSIAAVNTTLVAADPGGVGKWIHLEIEGSGQVTITKLSNFDTFDSPYTPANTPADVKVGAGDILLTADGLEGYTFSYWRIDDVETIEDPEYTFKTTKGTTSIKAVFIKTYYIYPIVYGPGTINEMDELDPIPVEAGADSPLFVFAPDSIDYHISSISIKELPEGDIDYLGYVTEYQFIGVDSDYELTVSFSETGKAFVAPDLGALVHILDIDRNLGLSLEFINPGLGGYAIGNDLFAPEGISFVWEINTDFDFGDYVKIALKIGDSFNPTDFIISKADSADQLYSDVTGDNKIDVDDLSAVAKAINDKGREYDPNYDVNRDGVLNQTDISTVQNYLGTELAIIPYAGTAPNFSLGLPQWYYPGTGDVLYILTDDFSIFKGR